MAVWLLAVVSVFGGYLYLASPNRAAKLAEDLLTALAGADVQIDSAHFDLDGSITLHGLEMRLGHVRGDRGRLFDAERVLIKHDLISLIKGVFRARTITFINPNLHLTTEADSGRFNFQSLHEQRLTQPGPDLPRHLPEIFVRNGRVLCGEIDAGRFGLLDTVYLSGSLSASPNEPRIYFFTLRQDQPYVGGDSGPVLSGRLDLKKLIVAAKLEHFTLGGAQRGMLPKPIRDWWDQLEPVGSLSSVRFGYNPDPQIGFNAQLELNNVAITLPYGELDSRMTDVSGRFTIVNQTITVTDLTGQIEELRYVINGRVQGFHRDAPFKLTVHTDPFAIPEKPRYLLALPTEVQKHFNRFTPSGVFQAKASLERSEPGGRLTYDGSVSVSEAKLIYHQFRYPLENVQGQLRFDDERIELIALRGHGPTGAKVVVNGVIAPPQDGAAVHVVVTAAQSPVDHVLYDAMPEKYRPILDMFFNEEAHRRLVEKGLIQTPNQQSQRLARLKALREQHRLTDPETPQGRTVLSGLDRQIATLRQQLEVPVFRLGGRVTVIAQTSRAYGPNQKLRTTVGLDLAGTNALLKHWPYPLRCTAGTLLVKPDRVIVDGIDVEGVTGASGSVSGSIVRASGRLEPKLDLVVSGMRCDQMLFASVPDPQDRWLGYLGLTGSLDGTGRIFRNHEEDRIDFWIETQLTHGRVRPYGGQFVADQITGNVSLGHDQLRIESLQGRCGSGRLTVSGSAQWGDTDAQVDLDINLAAMQIQKSLLDLWPVDNPMAKRLTALYAAHRPEGWFDADLSYRVMPGRDPDYRLDMKFGELGFDLHDHHIALTKVEGGFVVTPRGIELTQWGASFGKGRFAATGLVGFGPRRFYDLTFDARSERLGPVSRTVLPDAVLSVVDGLELNGTYDIRRARLVYEPDGEHPTFHFQGKAHLTDATATVGVPITQMNGQLEIRATREPHSSWPRVDLKFDAQRLLAARRLASPLSLHIVTADQPDRLAIQNLHGSCYGGTLLGSGEIHLGGQGLYQMTLVLQDVALNPFLYPEDHLDPKRSPGMSEPEAPDSSFTGVLAASLAIEGSSHEPTKRRGRGELEIRDANLYEVPLSLALMQILNLSLPASRSFDRASAHYLIDNDVVLFDSVRFEAPTIQIVGSGMMLYSTLELDLDLYTRNPAGPDLGPLSDLVGVFKDELLSIHVTGTLEDPAPSATSFRGFKRSWKALFGGGPPGDQRPLAGTRGGANTLGQ